MSKSTNAPPELLPCPCGAAGNFWFNDGLTEKCRVRCMNASHDLQTPLCANRGEAAAKWNTRAPSAPAPRPARDFLQCKVCGYVLIKVTTQETGWQQWVCPNIGKQNSLGHDIVPIGYLKPIETKQEAGRETNRETALNLLVQSHGYLKSKLADNPDAQCGCGSCILCAYRYFESTSKDAKPSLSDDTDQHGRRIPFNGALELNVEHLFSPIGDSPYCAYVQGVGDDAVCGGSEDNHPPYCSCGHAKAAHPKTRVRNGVAPGTPCRVNGCGCQTWFPYPDEVIRTIDAFEDYLPLSAVRVAPGEYEIKSRDGRTLWRMEGASLADWVCASCNGYSSMLRELRNLPWVPEKAQ